LKHFYEQFFARQLGKPLGLFGRFFMKRFLNKGNQRSNELALGHLELLPSHHVLEIGFGGGWLIQRLSKIVTEGKIVGLDHSKTMVEAARRSFRGLGDRVEFVCGNAEKLPFEPQCFARVCTVHALYFWKDPKRVFEEIYRVLQPGGTLVIGLHSKAKLETQSVTRHGFTLYEPAEVIALLSGCSFGNITLYSYDAGAWEDNHCIVAQRPVG